MKLGYRLLSAAIVLAIPALLMAQVDTLTILHVNDTHSNLSTIGPRNDGLVGKYGGIARAATLIGMERASNPNVLLLHAGDAFIGDVFYNRTFGIAELQMMLAMGFDAMTIGNHEFDLTAAMLDTSLRHAFAGGGFSVLSANLVLPDPSVQPLADFIAPYSIKQVGNLKVGIFGLTTPETNVLSQPGPAFLDTNILEIASAMVDTLKAKQCRVILCLSHLGVGLDSTLAYYVPGINAIIGGHDHYLFEKPLAIQNVVGETDWIVQANAFYLDLGKLRLVASPTGVELLDFEAIPITDAIPEEPTLAATVAALIADIESVYGPLYTQKLSYAPEFYKEVADSLLYPGSHKTAVGMLVTEAFRMTTHTEIAFEVGGSTAQPLYEGPITGADIFRMLGYGFNTDNGLGYRLATFDMKGSDLYAGIEFGLSAIEHNDEYFPQFSGLEYTYDPAAPPFSRLTGVSVNGVPLDPERYYSVTSNEFVPIFMNYLQIPLSNVHVFTDTTEFQVVAAYVAQFDTLGKLVTSVEAVENLPREFNLHQNYPNPFNPTTTISFDVPGRSFFSVKVYNILGQEVATLVNEILEGGTYRSRFDARGLPSGVYIYVVRAGGKFSAKKMILMK